ESGNGEYSPHRPTRRRPFSRRPRHFSRMYTPIPHNRSPRLWGMTPRPLRQRALVLLMGVLAVVAASLPAPAKAETSAQPVVVIGAAGLSWEDIDPETTPALWSLAQDGVGSLVVRSVRRSTCPLDGWLGLNTGERSADVSSRCRGLTEPVDGRISDWPQISAAVADQNFGARLGTFSELLERAGVRA